MGDYIEAQDYSGTVESIQIFHTILLTPDKKTIIIPNGPLSNGAAINYSASPLRRVDWNFGIGYTDSIDEAREIITNLLVNDKRVLKDPAPFVGVASLEESSINIVTRAWVNASDFWDLFFEMNEKVRKTFDQKGISIPFPQRNVHVYETKKLM